MKETFVNPFRDLSNQQNLYSLASGRLLSKEATEHLISPEKQGQGLSNDFSKGLHLSEEQTGAFFGPITSL